MSAPEDARRPRAHLVSGYLDRPADDPASTPDAVVVRADRLPRIERSLELGAVSACLFAGEAVEVSPHHREASDGLVVGLVVEGSVTVTQGDHLVTLGPGDLTFYDARSPFRLSAAGPHRYLVVRVPYQRMRGHAVDERAVLARDLSQHPSSSFLADLLQRVVDLPEECSAASAGYLGDAVASCVHAVLADSTAPDGPTSHVGLLFHRLTGWLDEHLTEGSTEALADAHFLSARYVRRIFAEHDTTVTDYLRRRRLEMVRNELLDPAHDGETVAAIGLRWGFRDASGLSRAFTREFGTSPQRLRRGREGPAVAHVTGL
jgi:AraC-like DNA-binding protein/mannose-6-phosphate isomerase-like protein (cupin superfamily)